MGHLILHEIRQRRLLFLVAFCLFVIFYYAYGQRTETMESLFMLVPILATSMIFGAEEEIEYIIVGRVPLWAVMVVRFITIYLSVTLLPTVFILCTRQTYIMTKVLFTFWITILMMCALGLFWRVVLKSAFASLLFSSLSYSVLTVLQWWLDGQAWHSIFAPFGAIALTDPYFAYNRLVVFGYTVVLLAGSALALKKRQNV